MINVLKNGSEGLREMAKRAEQLGIVMSDLNLAKVYESRKAWWDVKFALEGVWNALAVGLSGVLTIAFTKLADLIAETVRFAKTWEASTSFIVKLSGTLIDMWVICTTQIRILRNEFAALVALMGGVATGQFNAGLAQMDEYLA